MGAMKFGVVVPWATEREFTELATLAERHGWHGVFTWEAVWGKDAWGTLAAAAMVTERIRLGTLLTPASRHRPWDLATRVGTVDRLSDGRVIMAAGLGALHDNWLAFEADEGRRERAVKLDECLDVYAGLMAGQPFAYDGRHYSARPVTLMAPAPTPQRPRPPVWMVGAWLTDRPDDKQPSLSRAARWDGVLMSMRARTQAGDLEGRHVSSLEDFAAYLQRLRPMREALGLEWQGYDVVVEADSYGTFADIHGTPAQWSDAGATWWIESWWDLPDDGTCVDTLRERITNGPPA